MCGIAGFVGGTRSPEDAVETLTSMCDAIRHRGPDDAGYYIRPGVALGMRRLSIIDIEGGHQPIANEDSSVHVVFNGEIYNYQELRHELLKGGHRLGSAGDTETLVHLYEERGPALVHALRGMFTFAIWDSKRQQLLLTRDRLGIKPLYYWESDGCLAFGSELKSILAMPDAPRRIDPAAVADYLALGYVPDPGCIYSGIRKLEPGCQLTWQPGRPPAITRYWTPDRLPVAKIDEEEAAGEIRRLLTDAVHYRLISEVPLGAFLSGGLDSAAVVAEMSRQMDRPVRTFTIGFDEPDFNEAPHAAQVAAALRTEHTELIVRPEAEALIEGLVTSFDEPFADSSAIPTFLVSRLAREQVTVVLSGDGGDELFGGYTRYRELIRRNPPIPAQIRAAIGALARALNPGARGRNRLLELSRNGAGRYAGMVADPLQVSEGGVASTALAQSGFSQEDLLERWFSRVPDRDFATRMTLVDLISYLPGDILTKLDRTSMAVSLEARVPLLDHHLVEFAASLPSAMKIREGTGKWIFKKAVADLVPPSVLAKRKQGFGVPLALWFRSELRHRVNELLSPWAKINEYVDPGAVRRLILEHQAGRRDHSPLIWKLLVLEVWLSSVDSTRYAETGTSGMRLPEAASNLRPLAEPPLKIGGS